MVYASLDMMSAFTRMKRRHVLRQVRALCPELEPLFRQWYARRTIHVAAGGASESRVVHQDDGLDQGCPLSPAFFCIGLVPELLQFRDALLRLDARCRVWAYLDDVYFPVPKSMLQQAMGFARDIFGEAGLELSVNKTRLWCPDQVTDGLPADCAPFCVGKLPCLGSTLSFVRQRDSEDDEWRDSSVGIEDTESPALATNRYQKFAEAILRLAT